MGQGHSHDIVQLETRVEDPPDGQRPRGLALIAHGRLGGTFDQPPVRRLAEYLRDVRRLRVVTWNARGMGNSEGGNEWTDLGLWMGIGGVADYNRMLKEAMAEFTEDFPDAQDAELFICGYSAGSMFAGCSRPPSGQAGFSAPYYIFISYPVELNPLISLHKAGYYFRSLESLVRGHGWEKLPAEFDGKEPEVAGVFTVTGGYEKALFYGVWSQSLARSDSRKILKQVVVPGASHAWGDKSPRIVEEVDKWLQEIGPQPAKDGQGAEGAPIPQPTADEAT